MRVGFQDPWKKRKRYGSVLCAYPSGVLVLADPIDPMGFPWRIFFSWADFLQGLVWYL